MADSTSEQSNKVLSPEDEVLKSEAAVEIEGESRLDNVLEDFNLSRKELQDLRKLGKTVVPEMPRIVDGFYQWLAKKPYFDLFFPDTDRIGTIKEKQIEYWTCFFSGKIDDEYIASRTRVAEIHVNVELPLEYYMSAVNYFYESILKVIDEEEANKVENSKFLITFTKFLHLDMAMVANKVNTAFAQREVAQNKALWEISTPVTQIWDSVLMLPLTGFIDSKRALDITSKILEAISETHSVVFILDISGVGVVDSAVANYLIRITKATHLMGCETIISGLSPLIAQSIINLGIEVGNIKTTTTLRNALKVTFEKLEIEAALLKRTAKVS